MSGFLEVPQGMVPVAVIRATALKVEVSGTTITQVTTEVIIRSPQKSIGKNGLFFSLGGSNLSIRCVGRPSVIMLNPDCHGTTSQVSGFGFRTYGVWVTVGVWHPAGKSECVRVSTAASMCPKAHKV